MKNSILLGKKEICTKLRGVKLLMQQKTIINRKDSLFRFVFYISRDFV